MRSFLSKAVMVALVVALALGVASAQREGWPTSLTIGTASVGGTYFIYGGGWASLIHQELGVPTSTEVTGGPNQNMILVQNRNVELAMVTMGPAWEGWTGEGDWVPGGQEMKDVRALFPMYGTPFHIIALQGSGITSVEQLEGRAVDEVGVQMVVRPALPEEMGDVHPLPEVQDRLQAGAEARVWPRQQVHERAPEHPWPSDEEPQMAAQQVADGDRKYVRGVCSPPLLFT
jgi:hypothetical protein